MPPHSMQSIWRLIGTAVLLVRLVEQRPVRGGPPGAQEREEVEPVAALVEVEVGDEHRGFVTRRLHEHPPVRIADERAAVERDRAFGADAVRAPP